MISLEKPHQLRYLERADLWRTRTSSPPITIKIEERESNDQKAGAFSQNRACMSSQL